MQTNTYTVNQIDKYNFEIKHFDELIAQITYETWFSFNAQIKLHNGTICMLREKGKFGLVIELIKNEKPYYEFAMNWKNQIVINALETYLEKDFVFNRKANAKNIFTLTNKNNEEILECEVIQDTLKNTINTIAVSNELLEELDDKAILLAIVVHCTNYYLTLAVSY